MLPVFPALRATLTQKKKRKKGEKNKKESQLTGLCFGSLSRFL
jgi:hypothetical protein